MPDYIIRQRDWGQAEGKCTTPRPRPKLRGRGKSLMPRPIFWLRDHFCLEDLTLLKKNLVDQNPQYGQLSRSGPLFSVTIVRCIISDILGPDVCMSAIASIDSRTSHTVRNRDVEAILTDAMLYSIHTCRPTLDVIWCYIDSYTPCVIKSASEILRELCVKQFQKNLVSHGRRNR